jgi:Transposase DDE domain
MSISNHGRFRQQVRFLQRQFLQEGSLPFADVLSEETIKPALNAIDVAWKDRIYTPLVTLWVFLGQVLSTDHSCRAAVARLIAHRLSRGQQACSSKTGAYCQARGRLPEKFFSAVTCLVGRALDSKTDPKWLWKGRRVYMFDGTIVSMSDTPENQAAYPQPYNQRPGLGFPIARIGALTSLATGAIIHLGFSRYAGKGQGEVTLLRRLSSVFSTGDVLLADCLIGNWRCLYEMQQVGVDMITRLNKALRKADFREGQRLGKDDHLVRWPKPHIRGIGRKAQLAMPRYLTVREVRVSIKQPGFRTKVVIVVTTLLDPTEYTKKDLADLYRQRWNNELDLRSIKTTMQMDKLRCKTPELVHKEVWTHILAYNLIRTIMAQAAIRSDIQPRTISFKGALQTLEAFQPLIDFQGHRGRAFRLHLYGQLLESIACHRVADRPDRFEPRLRKRRPPMYGYLILPRNEEKTAMLKRRKKN